MAANGKTVRSHVCMGENYAVRTPFCLYLESVRADSEAASMDSAAAVVNGEIFDRPLGLGNKAGGGCMNIIGAIFVVDILAQTHNSPLRVMPCFKNVFDCNFPS